MLNEITFTESEAPETPSEELASLAYKYTVFNFLLINITNPGFHFAARCYLTALDDTGCLCPNLIFDLLKDLDDFYKARMLDCSESPSQLAARIESLANPAGFAPLSEERSDRAERVQTGAKKLYVPVTRKVSLTDETLAD